MKGKDFRNSESSLWSLSLCEKFYNQLDIQGSLLLGRAFFV